MSIFINDFLFTKSNICTYIINNTSNKYIQINIYKYNKVTNTNKYFVVGHTDAIHHQSFRKVFGDKGLAHLHNKWGEGLDNRSLRSSCPCTKQFVVTAAPWYARHNNKTRVALLQ